MELEVITETRICQLRNRSISKYLIKWKNLPLKIRSIHNYSSVEDNTFLKERGMLSPYTTHAPPIFLLRDSYKPTTVIVVPLH